MDSMEKIVAAGKLAALAESASKFSLYITFLMAALITGATAANLNWYTGAVSFIVLVLTWFSFKCSRVIGRALDTFINSVAKTIVARSMMGGTINSPATYNPRQESLFSLPKLNTKGDGNVN
jgi:hypothetical protein